VAAVTPQFRETVPQPITPPLSPTIYNARDFSIPIIDALNAIDLNNSLNLNPLQDSDDDVVFTEEIPAVPNSFNSINDPPLLNTSQDSDDDVVFIEEISAAPNNEQLEPLDPNAEFHFDISQLFANLEAYARSVFETVE